MRSKELTYSLVLLGALGLGGCGGGNGDSARVAQTVDASKTGVISVALADNEGSVHVSGNFQFNVIGTDKDGKQTNLNEQASWSLSDPSLGSIKNGFFTASGKVGALTLNVSYAGLTDSQNVTLTDANLVGITVEHESGSVDVCKNTQFTAKALFSDGKYYNYPLTWSLVDAASRELASFADETKADLSTKKNGAVKVVAKGKDNDAKVVTSPEFILDIDPTLVALTLTSDKSTDMNQGQTATATATAEYRSGDKVAITANAALKSSNETVMTVNPATGLITAVAGTRLGTEVNLTANCDETTSVLPLKVFKPEIRNMEIIAATGALTSTESLQVRVGGEIDPRIKVNYADSGFDPEVYTGNDVAWKFVETSGYDTAKITIDGASGLIKVDASLVQTVDLILTVEARITKIGGINTEIGSDGNELKDTIKVTIKP
ncbi:MAG: hypothetical protein K0Q78_707 [Cellvibrio sp.]|nr:hypothetical protein [Cellvibrio sp.]